jgi:hypothetical protein
MIYMLLFDIQRDLANTDSITSINVLFSIFALSPYNFLILIVVTRR